MMHNENGQKNSPWMDEIRKSQPLLDLGVVHTPRNLTDESHPMLSAAIMAIREDSDKPIKLMVSGDGGRTEVGFALYDLIKMVGNVHTHLLGGVYSAHATVWAAGHKRYVYANSAMGVHRSAMYWDSPHSMDSRMARQNADQLELWDRRTSQIFAAISDQDENWWYQKLGAAILQGTVMFDATQLVRHGMGESLSYPLPTSLGGDLNGNLPDSDSGVSGESTRPAGDPVSEGAPSDPAADEGQADSDG